MTVLSIVLLSIGTWGQRLIGMFVGARLVERRPSLGRLAMLIPAAVVMAVIVQLTVATGTRLVLDARAIGMALAAVLVWRRAPFIVVVIVAAAATALTRAVT